MQIGSWGLKVLHLAWSLTQTEASLPEPLYA